MPLTINTNLSSLIVQSNLKQSTNCLNQVIERMTTGFKINGAKDNAAGYSISTKMSTKLRAYEVAEDNANLGLEMVLTSSESLSLMSDLTARLRMLAVQAQNGTYSSQSLKAVNQEAQAIVEELYSIKDGASYNNVKLFNDFSSTVPTFDNGNKLVPNEKGFLKDIEEIDTSEMTRLEDIDENTKITEGSYSISTEAGLVKLAQMVNSGKITGNCTFVLAQDIDISNFCNSNLDSKGEGGWIPIHAAVGSIFDGNGHTISGLYINRPNSDNQGLFGHQEAMKVNNLGLINPVVVGRNNVGALRGAAYYRNTTNCFVEGGSVTGKTYVGGLVGFLNYDGVDSCYTTCNVFGEEYVGGIAGRGFNTLNNVYTSGDVYGKNYVGGLVANGSSANSAVYGVVSGDTNVGIFIGEATRIQSCIYNKNVNKDLGFAGNDDAQIINVSGINFGAKVNLQVGINSGKNSEIIFDAWFALDDLNRLNRLNIEDVSALKYIDGITEQINKKQAELGAIQNRIESALEQISVSYENLLSSRSTLQDADVAKESSAYIRNQILQQASATLLATANQTPALALQLL